MHHAPGRAQRVRRLPDPPDAPAAFAASTVGADLVFDGPAGKMIQVAIGRYHPVATKFGPIADPIVSLNDAGVISVPASKSQSLHVEIYVPHVLAVGGHRGTLTLRLALARSDVGRAGGSRGLGLHLARSSQLPARDELLRPARQ